MAAAQGPGPASSPNVVAPVLESRKLSAGYTLMPVIEDVDLQIGKGQVVALLGLNGAGKSTTVKALSGELKPMSGEVLFQGIATTDALHQRARHGMRLITEERSVFPSLSTADNLRLGKTQRDRCLELFPELEPLLRRKAGLLSGGEQQMLTLARALSAEPVLLLADELSLGLAPLVIERLLTAVRAAADSGTAVLLVEQQVRNALEVADYAYLLSHGRIVLQGPAAELLGRIDEIEATYLAGRALVEAD